MLDPFFAVFDLDGTLLDTLKDIAEAGNHALKKHGFPVHCVEAYKYFVGNGVFNLIRSALPEKARNDKTVQKVKVDYELYYSVHSRGSTRPYPGITESLDALKSCDIRLSVLSNKPHTPACSLVEAFFPGIFDIVLGQRDGIPHKPNPAAVFEIMTCLDVKPSEGFYIGDSSTDMLTGKNAGLYTIGVSWGFRTRDELNQAGADIIIDKPEMIPGIILDRHALHAL